MNCSNVFEDFNKLSVAADFMDFDSFKDVKSLIRLIHTQREVLVYSVGRVGNEFLDFLQYTNNLKYIACIAVKESVGNNTSLKISHFLPVIPLEMLLHFRESGMFIVSAPVDQHDEIRQNLAEFDFKKIIFLDETFQILIRQELKKLNDSGQIMSWFRENVVSKLGEIEYRIAEQNEVALTHRKTFAEYQNCFRDKKVVLVANGPTVKYYTPVKDAIHIGVNRAFLREDIPLDYLFAIDNRILDEKTLKVDVGFPKIHGAIFLSRHLDRVPVHYEGFSEEYYLMQDNIKRFYLNSCARFKDQPVYQDIANHALCDFGSVVFPALQFALWTYPKEIYLVGCDTTYEGHFYDEDDDDESEGILHTHLVKTGFARMKMFARLYYPETEIISVNPVNLKGLFLDTYTENYLVAQADSDSEG